MIYITGDCHGSFERFYKKQMSKLPFEFKEGDYVIICGDFGLLWARDNSFEYNVKWLSSLPFTILWVQGNHENYDMIEEYEIEQWNGGKVRHIARDKIILLERGQVFYIDGKTFFTFGGASSHDVEGGILDKNSPTYKEDKKRLNRRKIRPRINHISWWEKELPTKEELHEGRNNLEKVGYKVDYVISHCMSNRMQEKVEKYYREVLGKEKSFSYDILTDYFEELEEKMEFQHWFCGHYHLDIELDEKHTVTEKKILQLSES